MESLRTPDERFADLPGYAYAPNYADVGGVRDCAHAGGLAADEAVQGDHPERERHYEDHRQHVAIATIVTAESSEQAHGAWNTSVGVTDRAEIGCDVNGNSP